MSLVEHAKRELELAGLFDKDSDYGGMLGEAVMELVEVFEKQGHSGYSAALVRNIFSRVADYKVLTPIGTTEDEWYKHEYSNGDVTWQNKRQSSVFSNDGGKTWYDIDDSQPAEGAKEGIYAERE